MVKYALSFLFLSFSFLLNAQNHRIFYEYSFKMDSLHRENVVKELMVLDITKNGSNYYSQEKFVYDSLVNEQFSRARATQSSNINLSKIPRKAKVSHTVTKKYPAFEADFHTSINGDNFVIKETEKQNWKISPETSEIGGMKAQKATTDFGGRKWIAWFTNEIQFQDGPYKFHGLPGLILNLEDEKGDHIFRFAGSKKMPQKAVIFPETKEDELLITKEKFKQLWREYLKDPAKKIRQMLADSEMQIKVTDQNGKELSNSEIIRSREQRAKEALKKTNNFLELSLYR
ncbi:GLPGLI family protein [Kaistella treverensis]|uniref:GLPGLI family protein n=1 Tax=Kaistella treverensis TaxID=631455 RepID=A0A1I3K7P8_9FLAO|nr:GLPGLI family protein [Kaistella treverensis]SFI68205.1 GLPGLI family protein [Kaistella treverensis]